MNNGNLPIHIQKRLNLEMNLRMCAGILKKKQHDEQGNQHICLQLLKIIKIGLLMLTEKNMRYGHLHFMLMVAYRCR